MQENMSILYIFSAFSAYYAIFRRTLALFAMSSYLTSVSDDLYKFDKLCYLNNLNLRPWNFF